MERVQPTVGGRCSQHLQVRDGCDTNQNAPFDFFSFLFCFSSFFVSFHHRVPTFLSIQRYAKTAAERAGWKYVEDNAPSFKLVTINPPMIVGPWLPGFARQNDSSMVVHRMLTGETKEAGDGTSLLRVFYVSFTKHVRAATAAKMRLMLLLKGTRRRISLVSPRPPLLHPSTSRSPPAIIYAIITLTLNSLLPRARWLE